MPKTANAVQRGPGLVFDPRVLDQLGLGMRIDAHDNVYIFPMDVEPLDFEIACRAARDLFGITEERDVEEWIDESIGLALRSRVMGAARTDRG